MAGAMALTNLAVDEELRDRVVGCNGWRTLLMAMSSENPQARNQRSEIRRGHSNQWPEIRRGHSNQGPEIRRGHSNQ